MKHKVGDIIKLNTGVKTLEILKDVSISRFSGEKLIGQCVVLTAITNDYGRKCYAIKHNGNRWMIPIECFEPVEITNWRGEFETKGRETTPNSIKPNGGD